VLVVVRLDKETPTNIWAFSKSETKEKMVLV